MAIKDASHVFGWANTWNPLNGLCSLVHFARELFGSSHIFASVSRKLNRIDVTGEKLSSACRHIRGSQKKLCQTGQQWMLFLPPPPPQNALIPSWMLLLPTVPVLGEMTQAWHEEHANFRQKRPWPPGDLNPSFLRGYSANHHPTRNQITQNEKKYWLEDATRLTYCLMCRSLLKKKEE